MALKSIYFINVHKTYGYITLTNLKYIFLAFQNLIEKPEETQTVKENCISMVQCKVMKQLEFIEQRKFEDEDIQSDIEFLKEKMEMSLQDLSSYDEYVTEVRSGRFFQGLSFVSWSKQCRLIVNFSPFD